MAPREFGVWSKIKINLCRASNNFEINGVIALKSTDDIFFNWVEL